MVKVDFCILKQAEQKFEKKLIENNIIFSDKNILKESLGIMQIVQYKFKIDHINTRKKLMSLCSIAKNTYEEIIKEN